MECCELQNSIPLVDDRIKYARGEKITVDDERKTQSLERGAEFNLIPHNRTYNLARTNTGAGVKGKFHSSALEI